MTWILIMWLAPGWQVTGTGDSGMAIHSTEFNTLEACASAQETLKKMDKRLYMACVAKGDKVQ